MRITGWLVIAGWLLGMAEGGAAQTTARLVLGAESAKPGETVMAGVHLSMPGKWHTYWRNPGDSGAATRIDWQLPAGVTAGEIAWPVPEQYDTAGLLTYVYHKEVVLLVPLRLSADVPKGPLRVAAKVKWLECENVCLPGSGQVQGELMVGETTKPSTNAALLAIWQARVPKPDPAIAVRAYWEQPATNSARPLILEVGGEGAASDFFPYEAKDYQVSVTTDRVGAAEGKVRLRKVVRQLKAWPTEIAGVVVRGSGGKGQTGTEVRVAIQEGAQIATTSSGALGESGKAGVAAEQGASLAGMLALAFLGGLILNIMPCVLPVIALKVLGFVHQGREEPGRVRWLGILYAAGVLVSFMALAGLVIGVQRAGRLASWGMQFQNPQFVIVMTTVVVLVALNLFGVFEVNLGGAAMDAASGAAARTGSAGAFLNGVLATALATPCTAPYLAVALGFAFVQPAHIILLFFIVMALGFAGPYVLLSAFPRGLRFVPKPGVWMEHFKKAMGFPMVATAVWLMTLTVPHFGGSGPLWLGLFLVMLSLAAWIYGQFVQRGSPRKTTAAILGVLVLVIGYAYALEMKLQWRHPPAPVMQSAAAESGGIAWQPWSPEAVRAARAKNRIVLVDFTADWCVTCQANKASSLEIPAVSAKLRELNAVALLGDFTREDPAIAAELRRYKRAGVPLVLVYPADSKKPAIVLPSVLTPGIVLDALRQAGQ